MAQISLASAFVFRLLSDAFPLYNAGGDLHLFYNYTVYVSIWIIMNKQINTTSTMFLSWALQHEINECTLAAFYSSPMYNCV